MYLRNSRYFFFSTELKMCKILFCCMIKIPILNQWKYIKVEVNKVRLHPWKAWVYLRINHLVVLLCLEFPLEVLFFYVCQSPLTICVGSPSWWQNGNFSSWISHQGRGISFKEPDHSVCNKKLWSCWCVCENFMLAVWWVTAVSLWNHKAGKKFEFFKSDQAWGLHELFQMTGWWFY